MPLRITRKALEQIRRQAAADHPIETCGVIAAACGSRLAERVIAMRNQAASPTWFSFDPREQLRVWRELDEHDEECRVIYHSHTASEAWPSRDDIAHALDPELHYLIVSTWPGARHPLRSFRIVDGRVFEEHLAIHE
ncbi:MULTISPECIES: M67 family metallopeptidase [Pseudomonas]|uniref:Proteasome lid subunit RPN8/RPN11 n=1 Tax=Pseudomonas hunanensis TaxID=1247546 RepID=A0ACC6K0R7_9PSED|nr:MULTISPECIES: M67 family metallopeptidase [Pseudomonas]MBP2260199.1 proteasome lid subunit RPN8/RPN11 [Pseudomonas sp. BP8]MDR6712050.1 proteasome lid subunit RPN8/RPN11 [Pseudomonas hunanensis]HDS1737549.1 M67 family metallopeptidase [Pseudomonas putida]